MTVRIRERAGAESGQWAVVSGLWLVARGHRQLAPATGTGNWARATGHGHPPSVIPDGFHRESRGFSHAGLLE